MEKKQTAVHWLIEQVHSDQYQMAFGQTYISIELVEQAKQMEKEQIIEAYFSGDEDAVDNPLITAEQYYNETYNSKK